MNRLLTLRHAAGMIAGLVCWVAVASLPPTAAASDGSPAAEWNNAFARDMLGKLGDKHRGENFAFSPFSIVTAFGMTHAGARGDTAAQIEEVFHFIGGTEAHADLAAWAAAVREAGDSEDIEFRLANRAWFQMNWPVNEEFLRVLHEQYDAPAGRADFVTQPEFEQAHINDWVFEQTKERIADLLPPGSINGLTRFVLVNALYFRGLWEFPFVEEATSDAPFHVGEGETITVAMMYGDSLPAPHTATGIAEAIALPVKDGSFSLVIVLPNEGVTVDEVLTAVADGEFPLAVAEWEASPQGRYVLLPRFRVEAEIKLTEVLQSMGVVDAFSAGLADFSGIYSGPEPQLHLTAAFHKTFVDVNESGLEASGATAVVGGITSVPPAFHVNRPFLFFVTEDTTGTILFGGQVVRPVDPSRESAPVEPDGDRLLQLVVSEGGDRRSFAVRLTCAADAVDDLVLQASRDLVNWEEIEFTAETTNLPSDNRTRLHLAGEVPPDSGDALFFRVVR